MMPFTNCSEGMWNTRWEVMVKEGHLEGFGELFKKQIRDFRKWKVFQYCRSKNLRRNKA